MNAVAAFCLTIVCFAVAVLGSYLFTKRRMPKTAQPSMGSNLRLKCSSGVYRSKLLQITPEHWRVSSPLSRDHYVPLRPGELLTIEAPVSNGVLLGHTTVISRDAETKELVLKAPNVLTVHDRREEPRQDVNKLIGLDMDKADLLNISTLGACLLTNQPYFKGDRVRVQLPTKAIYAWVMETGSYASQNRVRVRFEEAIDLKLSLAGL
jgi:hypothetical protein